MRGLSAIVGQYRSTAVDTGVSMDVETTTRPGASARLATFACLMALAACTTLPGSAAPPGPALRAHAWPVPECPSDRSPAAGVLPAPVIGTAVDMLLDRIAGALGAAAAADRDGRAYSGTDAGYLYFGRDTGGAAPVAALAGCVIIAVAGDDEPAQAPLTPAAKPALLAELRLEPSRDGAAIRPRVVALYYPQALQRRAHASRDLAFTLQLRLPEQSKGANLFVLLRGLEPGRADYDATALGAYQTLWTVAPAYSGRKLTADDLGAGVGAINIHTEVRETGDTNAFLQALAASFADTRSGYAKALQ